MEEIKGYRIYINIHGGGWKDKYDLRDKIMLPSSNDTPITIVMGVS